MIKTIAELLEQFKLKEIELLKKYDIVGHPPLIGDMYEGLTKEILAKSLFEGFDLKISAGKIKNSKNELSKEIDCMLVIGEGEKIPYTDKFIYPLENVIAVIEVKKTLYTDKLESSYYNLKSIIDISEFDKIKEYSGKLLRNSYRLIAQNELPERKELNKLPITYEMLYHYLLLETILPVRIVFGYDGFKTEYSLREGFVNFLEKNRLDEKKNYKKGFGPLNFPNLIVCNNFSMSKINGMPYGAPIIDNTWLPIYGTSSEKPLYHFLEMIYSRLEFKFKLSSNAIFGDDMDIDFLNMFLIGRVVESNGLQGWDYNYIELSSDELKEIPKSKEWQPVLLNKEEFIIVNILCQKGFIDMDSIQFKEFKSENPKIEEYIIRLNSQGLIYKKDNKLGLLTDECLIVNVNGEMYAGENKTHQMVNWANKQIKK